MASRKLWPVMAAVLTAAMAQQRLARAEQWAYAMQTGHGNHSIQVDVDSIVQGPGYVAARLLYEYYGTPAGAPDPAAAAPRSALVDGAFDCQGNRFQALSRTEYAAPEGKGPAGTSSHSPLAPDRWRLNSADPETFAIVDWVCSVAAHKLAAAPGSAPRP